MIKTLLQFTAFLLLSSFVFAQNVQVGAGSYGTVLPSGTVGPQYASGATAVPKVSAAFSKPAQTCDYWTSLIFPFYGDQHSNNIFAHPLYFRAKGNGLQVGHTLNHVFAAQDYLYPFSQQMTVGITGLNVTKTLTDDYGDWTVTALWDDGTRRMKATLGHGLPFVFFTISGGNASITLTANPNIWFNQNGVLGISVEGRHYGIFAPDSSVWTGTTLLQSSLNNKDYLSIALLPDNTPATLEFFRKRAYAFVTGSEVSWVYNQQTSKLITTFAYTTEFKENRNGNLNQTLSALYRHQYINSSVPLTAYEYTTVAGKMKLFDGSQFETSHAYEGVLPGMPDAGIYNRADLLAMLNSHTSETLPASGDNSGTYWNGKLMARMAHLVGIADQLGAAAQRDYFLTQIKTRLEEWFTAGGPQSYVYNAPWRTLTGYPSEYGADNQINDHNFHSGYAIMAAAIVAQYDPVWASQENWGGMVNLLIKDGNNWDRNDTRFPFLRAFDSYAGHSWASGHGDFGDGNNEESSSEAMNFATAVILWGSLTQQDSIRDLGIYLHATQRSAIEQYWLDVDNVVFPAAYTYKGLGMIWGAKGVHSTWFGANPDFIHGINMLPYNGGSLYLGRYPEYVQSLHTEIIAELNGADPTWKDIIWKYQAFVDPSAALSSFFADSGYIPEAGGTKAHTYHWLGNMKKMGKQDITVTADIATYAVFKDNAGYKTYIAFNPDADSVTVYFSDNFTMRVGPRRMKHISTSPVNPDAPIVLLTTNKTSGKSPLKVSFSASRSYDRNNSPLTFLWNFGDGSVSSAADTIYTFTVPGEYTTTVTVANPAGLVTIDSVKIRVLGNGTPYTGTAVNLPGIIQAENYDNGGEGVAYHDVNSNNIGLAYRPNEGVDIEPSSTQGFDVYWMVDGEWLEYTVNAARDTVYDITANVATVPGFGYFRLFVNNEDVSGKKFVLNTGGWQNWRPITVAGVPMQAGTNIIRFEVYTDVISEKRNWLFSLNWFDVAYSSVTGNSDYASLPAEFELNQNYPNPFNPATTISYTLAHDSRVTLSVYTILGEEALQVLSETLSSGKHSARFDASGLPSGVYFYKLTADPLNGSPSYQAVRKMTVLK
ncbi:MAG: hypothetical protein FMNOHCHN_00502 [Ignavibacteriaceae bacterium]|nr:hypothetical protein [Ignavibacteriaceae bacterium]